MTRSEQIPFDIPSSLAPFFQEYDLAQLDVRRSAATIIERTLRFGNREELRWLFRRYPRAMIINWVKEWGDFVLPEPHLAFWRLVLDLEKASWVHASTWLAGLVLLCKWGTGARLTSIFFSETEDIPALRERIFQVLKRRQPVLVDQSWANLLFLADSVQVGFYGYGYKMVEPTVRAADIQLASVTDIGLMKLDALSGRASQKDFIDLYFICQEISLQQLLYIAPDIYLSVCDFEAQIVRQLAYFERADLEEPVPLRQEVAWESVKDFFRQQAVELGRRWLND